MKLAPLSALQRHCLAFVCLGLALGCSKSEQPRPPGGAGAGGSAGATSTSSAGGGLPGGGAGEGGGAGAPSYPELGVCGRRGQATVDTGTHFDGYEEFFILGEEGFGDDVCAVRFSVERVGPAPAGCDAAAGPQNSCAWTHRLRYTNPSIERDVDGACAASELGLDAAAIARLDGSEVAYGFVIEYQGHLSVLMEFDEALGQWQPAGNAIWDPASLDFRFDRREGYCEYGMAP